jgi:hypothetical protein
MTYIDSDPKSSQRDDTGYRWRDDLVRRLAWLYGDALARMNSEAAKADLEAWRNLGRRG